MDPRKLVGNEEQSDLTSEKSNESANFAQNKPLSETTAFSPYSPVIALRKRAFSFRAEGAQSFLDDNDDPELTEYTAKRPLVTEEKTTAAMVTVPPVELLAARSSASPVRTVSPPNRSYSESNIKDLKNANVNNDLFETNARARLLELEAHGYIQFYDRELKVAATDIKKTEINQVDINISSSQLEPFTSSTRLGKQNSPSKLLDLLEHDPARGAIKRPSKEELVLMRNLRPYLKRNYLTYYIVYGKKDQDGNFEFFYDEAVDVYLGKALGKKPQPLTGHFTAVIASVLRKGTFDTTGDEKLKFVGNHVLELRLKSAATQAHKMLVANGEKVQIVRSDDEMLFAAFELYFKNGRVLWVLNSGSFWKELEKSMQEQIIPAYFSQLKRNEHIFHQPYGIGAEVALAKAVVQFGMVTATKLDPKNTYPAIIIAKKGATLNADKLNLDDVQIVIDTLENSGNTALYNADNYEIIFTGHLIYGFDSVSSNIDALVLANMVCLNDDFSPEMRKKILIHLFDDAFYSGYTTKSGNTIPGNVFQITNPLELNELLVARKLTQIQVTDKAKLTLQGHSSFFAPAVSASTPPPAPALNVSASALLMEPWQGLKL